MVEKAELPFKAEYNDHYLKFAEDVVKECIQVCTEQRNPSGLNFKFPEQVVHALRLKFNLWK